MNVTLREPWTVERFLQWEDGQEARHEFDGTRIMEVTGGSRTHQEMVFNLVQLLKACLDGEQFDVVMEMRVQIGRRVRYPDVSVTRGRIGGATRTLRDAAAVFEVLSDETAETDQGDKRMDYAQLPGIRNYVLLDQSRMAASMLERTADGWIETHATTELAFPALGVTLPLCAIYRNVRFD